jgi:hypothetical protein
MLYQVGHIYPLDLYRFEHWLTRWLRPQFWLGLVSGQLSGNSPSEEGISITTYQIVLNIR